MRESDTPLIDHLVMREFVSGPPSYRFIYEGVCERKPSLRTGSWAVCGFRTESLRNDNFLGARSHLSSECLKRTQRLLIKHQTLLHASLDAFDREEIWHVCLIVVVKDIRKSSETMTGWNICESFNVCRVLRWWCNHRYWLWNCSDFRQLPRVSCVFHDNYSEIVWSSDATSINLPP